MNGRLLFVARRPPWPLDNGGRIRSHRLVTGLAERFETVLLTMEHHGNGPDGGVDSSELQRVLPGLEVRTVPGFGPGKRANQLRSVPGRRSWSFGRYATPALRRALDDVIAERQIDLVHFDDLGVAQLLPLDRTIAVYSSHNVENEIIRGDARAAGGTARRKFAELELRKVEIEERRVWHAADLTLAVSPYDAGLMRAGGAREVDLCPNGTDRVSTLQLHERQAGEPLRMVFVGSGAFPPYERGLAWFCQSVLPLLQDRITATLDVVGQPPRRPVAAPGVTYHGYVPDLQPWYAKADVVVVPVFEGSGTRLKLVEAAARGRPIVTTLLGAQGLPLVPGVHYLAAEDVAGFVTALSRVAAGDEEVRSMVPAARAAVEPLFWPNITEALSERYQRLIDVAP